MAAPDSRSKKRASSAPAVGVSETAAKFLHEFYETYFQPLETPLKWGKRFSYAFLGAFSLFAVAPLLASEIVVQSELDISVKDPVFVITPFMFFYVGLIGLLSAFFAHLISWAKTRHGPVRLYLSGVLLPALVIYIMKVTWAFDEMASVANQQ